MTKISTKTGVQQLVSGFLTHGIKHIVFSPGSRNAPLVVSFANDDRFNCYVIPDERCAAFYALGIAEQLQQPVAVMCTSGSALLNYYPAISEAFYRQIPLVIVSADRPKEWIDQGDGQTIRQENAFSNHIVSSTQLLEQPQNQDQIWWNKREIRTVLCEGNTTPKGPIHINFPFSEPLYEIENQQITPQADFDVTIDKILSRQVKDEMKTIWNASSKKLILCGQLPKNSYLNEQLKQLAADKSVAVVVENTSNLQDRSFIHCIDRTINSFTTTHQDLYQPDLLITIGGAVISKKVKKWIRTNPPRHHWKVGEDFPFMDTYQSVTKSITVTPNTCLSTLLEEGFERNTSRFGSQWKQLDYLVQDKHFEYLKKVPYSDLTVFNFILDAVPDQSALHIGNSSAIRYTQLFDPIKSITYYCNRGTSGIDGSMSTAIGHCMVGKQNVHTLIIGDMSFLYDSNALWSRYVPTNFRIFLINNGGGDIFNIIPGPKNTPNLDEYFVVKHQQSVQSICAAFDINYYAANSIAEIDHQIDAYYDIQDNNRPALMEISTQDISNSNILKEYFEKIKVVTHPKLKI